jgi:DNA-binding NarL/FixJ family response regulator
MPSVSSIQVAVLEEHDIFRRGIVACLADDPSIDIVFEAQAGPVLSDPDIAVVSHAVALGERLTCPLVVCSTDRSARAGRYEPNVVLGVLPRTDLTGEQLVATVRAAATGLRVQPRDAEPPQHDLDDRSLEVLRLLSRGADTQQISHALSYSERTVKTLIADLQRNLGARNRTHAVAEGMRHGFI